MTTVSRVSATCAVCGQWQQVPTLASTSSSGWADLDGRPAGHRRSTMEMWGAQCGRCGHVAGDLSAAVEPDVAALVRSPAYTLERTNPQRPPLANRFVCGALLQERAGNLEEAAWQRVYAAWACDDAAGGNVDALRERALAVALFDRAQPSADRDADDVLWRHATRVDLARRAGMYGRAFALAIEGAALAEAAESTDDVRRLRAGFALQQKLVQAGDRARYTWRDVVENRLAPEAKPLTLPEPPSEVLDVVNLEAIAAQPYLPRWLIVGSVAWEFVDELEMLDTDSEQRHAFATTGATDTYRSRQKLKYPCGTMVEDVGRAHVGGTSTYKILDLTPGRDVLIVRRLDYVYGDYELEMLVDGVSAGVQAVVGQDRVHRWRNWSFVIPGALVKSPDITVEQVARTAGRDVNMFHYWFFQRDD